MADEVTSDPDPANDFRGSVSDSEADSDDSEAVETLVAGKEKRATAGRRRTELVELEEDDELELLMQEDEDDEEFEEEDEDAGSDAELSSDDDDDQGPNAATDDLEGERELQQRAKLERAKKRKAMNALTSAAGVQKKVKINPSATEKESAPRPSKKKERESWLPDDKSGPSRTSMRWQTKANTETTLLRVAKNAEESAKTKRRLQKLQREKEKDKPKELTQADRLAEAERTERKNAKSLNRWEAMEKKRAEEQAAKLAALKDRKLEGPVISSWSGAAQWLGAKLVKVGGKETNFEPAAEPKKRGRKPKGYWEAMDRRASLVAGNSAFGTPQEENTTPAPSEAAIDSGAPSEAAANAAEPTPTPITFTAPQNPDNFLNGIKEITLRSSESCPALAPASSDAPPTSTQAVQPIVHDPQYHPPLVLPPVSETATRNLVILESFDKLTAQDRADQALFYNNRKTPKPTKQAQELCPITSLPAKYRDPSTGVPYANSYAYRKLQDLKKHRFIWSSMLGCFVGPSGIVARGVPEGFSGA